MTTFLIILGVVAVAAGAYYFFLRTGRLTDADGDFIADEVEELVDDAKEEIIKTKKELKKRVRNVKEEVSDVIDELSDVVSAVKGKPTKSKLNSLTKQQLVDSTKADHGIELDIKTKKSTLVNKVYSIYNNK